MPNSPAGGIIPITNLGAGILIQNPSTLPLGFALSLDNFRTDCMCRLIWRQRDFLGVAFAG